MKRLLNKQNDGFTLVELLIVVAIIGIIAAIAIPNLLSAIQRGKQKRSMGDIKTVASTIEQYNTDSNSYPAPAANTILTAITGAPLFGVAATQLDSNYLATPIWKDGWSTIAAPTPFSYGADGVAGAPPAGQPAGNYAFCSRGKDAIVGAHVYACAPAAAIASIIASAASFDGTSFNCDITIVDGQFMAAPIGKQSQAVC